MDVAYSMYKETFVAKAQWSIDQIPDLAGQVMIVTGGNAGIGKETIKVLLAKGAKVYIGSPVFLRLDLADLNSVWKAFDEFEQKEDRPDVLFNNGGVMATPIEMKTPTGYDIQFATSVLGHYQLTVLLIPVLIHTAKNSPRKHARVINVSSSTYWLASRNEVDYSVLTPNGPEAEARRRKMNPDALYWQSKWSGILRHVSGILPLIARLLAWPIAYGAITLLYAGTMPEAEMISG
ncbi:short chain dehydrogenase [Ceratobasidium sp. AG-Ba]|nr:short chain dehydrogenase [Ceratobasidium sp. AG-Ba]QRW10696.1 short chain dehydrogenase [Ceratobasidium sp. AG-Ba]